MVTSSLTHLQWRAFPISRSHSIPVYPAPPRSMTCMQIRVPEYTYAEKERSSSWFMFLEGKDPLPSGSLIPGPMPGTEGCSADVCGINVNQKTGEAGSFYSSPQLASKAWWLRLCNHLDLDSNPDPDLRPYYQVCDLVLAIQVL